jgi:hypothetical protein
MAIQVTGLFQNPISGLIYQSPTLKLVPILQYYGMVQMDVFINENVGAVPYPMISRNELTYDTQITDPYDQLIDALENYVIDDLQNANSINSGSTFTKFTPTPPPLVCFRYTITNNSESQIGVGFKNCLDQWENATVEPNSSIDVCGQEDFVYSPGQITKNESC